MRLILEASLDSDQAKPVTPEITTSIVMVERLDRSIVSLELMLMEQCQCKVFCCPIVASREHLFWALRVQ